MKSKKTRITFTLDNAIVTQLKSMRETDSLNVSGFVNKAVKAALSEGRSAQK